MFAARRSAAGYESLPVSRKNPDVASLHVGMKVTTDFIPGEEDIVRTLTSLKPTGKAFGSGYCATADGGEERPPCPYCQRPHETGTPIGPIDAAFFLPAEGE